MDYARNLGASVGQSIIKLLPVAMLAYNGNTPELVNPTTGPSISPMGKYYRAAVAADNVLCSEIGRDMLIAGGNAIDAGVAALFCAGVMNPHSCGIGGGHFTTIYHKETKTCTVINAREKAPAASTQNMYRGTTESQIGWRASGVPGELAGLWVAHKKFGSLPWRQLVMPTVRLLRVGFPVSEGLEHALKAKREQLLAEPTMQIFINPNTGDVFKAGDVINRPVFANTLERLANSSDAMTEFYQIMAQDMAEEFQAKSGYITEADFNAYDVEEGDVIKTNLENSGMTICGPPPPCSSSVAQSIINVMDRYGIDGRKAKTNAKYLGDLTHHVLEAMKFGYAARSNMGDTDAARKIARNITTSAYADDLLNHRIIDEALDTAEEYGVKTSAQDGGTSHVAVLDPFGNAMSTTTTINTYFGAIVRSEKTGIIWNNEMDDFSTPGLNNAWGFRPSTENFIEPGKRPFSSISPLIIYNQGSGKVEMVVGSEGGSRIISTVAQIAIRSLFLNETIKEAVDARRIHNQIGPFETDYEEGYPEAVVRVLSKDYGQDVKKTPLIKTVAATAIRARDNGLIYANSDFRKGSSAGPAGY